MQKVRIIQLLLYLIKNKEIYMKCFKKFLFRFQQAWNSCEKLNEKDAWLKLGQSAIANLNVEFGKMIIFNFIYLLQTFYCKRTQLVCT